MRALLLLAVVTLGAAAGAAAQQTELKAWLAPGCHAFPVELAAGQQRFQLLTAADAESVKTSGVWAKCLSQSADGACTQPADGSEAACNLAIESGARTGLEGQLMTTSAGEAGFVYAMNPESYPVLVDILVVVQPSSAAAAADATAVGSYRRALLSRAIRASGAHTALHSGATAQATHWLPRRQLKQTDTTTIVPADGGNSGNSGSTPTPSGSSPTPTPSPSSSNEASNYIDRIANKFDDPTVRKWVKIAIIILIVLICLSILSCLFCILRCICWPCCCAARGFK